MISNTQEKKLGERLRTRREELGFSMREFADLLQTSQRFVKALENEEFQLFSAKIYARSFLKRAIVLLNLTNETPELMYQLENGWQQAFPKQNTHTRLIDYSYFLHRKFSITIARTRRFLMGASLLFLLFFFGYRVIDFIRPPSLVIEEPKERELRRTDLIMHVQGVGEKESRLTVNGREITMSELGNFDDIIELRPGLNILEFRLENRFQKVSKITKYVLVE